MQEGCRLRESQPFYQLLMFLLLFFTCLCCAADGFYHRATISTAKFKARHMPVHRQEFSKVEGSLDHDEKISLSMAL